MRIGIQLYTLRNVYGSLSETIQRIGQTPFEGVEFAGLGNASPTDVASALDSASLDVAGAHVSIDEFDDYQGMLATYETIGCKNFVIPSYEHEAFETEEGVRKAGHHLSGFADCLADNGASLHYHNHTFEFTALDGETAFDIFADAAEGVGLEIDTGLASYASVDPISLLERYGDRVTSVHLTDTQSGSDDTLHVDLGTGEVPLRDCVDACADVGVDWLLFEHGLTNDPIASMEAAADAMDMMR